MLLTEKFHSIQGEGRFTGIPMFFVRTSTCNLRCRWCDTTYSFTGGHDENSSDLARECIDAWEEWICLTGGEPLLQRDAIKLVTEICSTGKKVLIETGGSLDIAPYTKIDGTVIDMDIKTPSSGEEKTIRIENLSHLRQLDYVKMVISDMKDFEYSCKFVEEHVRGNEVIFQPAWGTDPAWIVDEVLKRKLPVRVMLQAHKYIWGERRGV